VTSIERTAYPRFKRLPSVRELHVFYTPQPDKVCRSSPKFPPSRLVNAFDQVVEQRLITEIT